MATGTVDFFNDAEGYGFIDPEDSDEDIFFHMENVSDQDIKEGIEVEFEIANADGGPTAVNVVTSGTTPSPSIESDSSASDATIEDAHSEITKFLNSHAPRSDSTVNINVSDSRLEGQFKRLQHELDIKESEVNMLRELINEIIDDQIENGKVAMDAEMKEATANIIASTLMQEYTQTSEES
jgi:CspA family cold shock protein